MSKFDSINIHPSGTPADNVGMPASKDLRETPKGFGKRKVVGVIRDGKYVDPETGKPITIGKKKINGIEVNILKYGGVE